MKLLLDTHSYFWWAIGNDKRISAVAKKAIAARGSQVFVSAVSAYELAYKYRSGRLATAAPILIRLQEDLAERNFFELPLSLEHGRRAGELADEHGDPFDRLLAAQAIVEDMAIVSNDERLSALGAKRLW